MKKKFIDSIRVADPCHESWDEMTGNERMRFCSHCATDVNDISRMTRREVRRLVRRSGGKLCVRYVQNPETKAPIFTPITRRRAPLMAAGVVGASLSLATMTFAQGSAVAPRRVTNLEQKDDSGRSTKPSTLGLATIKGKVTGIGLDAIGALVSLLDKDGTTLRVAQVSDAGEFTFDIEPGTYSIKGATRDGSATLTIPNFGAKEGLNSVDLRLVPEGTTVSGNVIMLPLTTRNPLALTSVMRVEIAQDKLAQGEDVDQKDDEGSTPLFSAVEDGDLELVKFLLDHGAKVNVRNNDKETPLMMIEENTPLGIVELLLQRGAKVNRVDSEGDTALMRAAASRVKPGVLRALINAGADLNIQNEEGMTALMEAADNNDLENVRVLLEAGADVNLRDAGGDNAWDYATEKEIEDLLMSYGAEEAKDGEGEFKLSQPTHRKPDEKPGNPR